LQETPTIEGVSIRRRLAVGGMGELFLGDETLPDGSQRPCVVKRLLPGAGPEERRLFEREALALGALRGDPHIVELYRAGPDWLLLEWVDGVDLATLLDHRQRRGRPLPLGAAMAVSLGLARALASLTTATDPKGQPLGLVHRDIHPGNVLLGRDGRVKLADFGVVALAAATQGVKGTLAWMAPEQLHSGHTTPASDVYAAALVMYACFTGKSTLPTTHGIGDLLAARATLPPPPSAVRTELTWLDPLMMSALAVDPAARPPIAALCSQLEAAPIAADPTALGALVAPLTTTLRPAQRTLHVATEAATPRAPLWPMLAVLAAGLGLTVVVLVPCDDPTTLAPRDTIPEALATPDTALTAPRVAADTFVAPETLTPDTLTPIATPDTREALLDTHAPRSVDTRAPRALQHRLRVVANDAPVHVRGPTSRGLAPWSSEAITTDGALSVTLTGGTQPLRATLRVKATQAGLVASLGADEVLRVTCGTRNGQTPLFGIGLGAAGVPCRLEADDGRSMSFVLFDVSE
jgi:serine/threonine protein kinase